MSRSLKNTLTNLSRQRVLSAVLFLLAILSIYRLCLWYWGDYVRLGATTLTEATGSQARFGLNALQVRIEDRPVAGVEKDLSGLAFDPDCDCLWGVTNAPTELISLSTDGQLLSRHPLEGFSDVEDIDYLGNAMVIVTEERRQRLLVFKLPQRDGEPVRQADTQSLMLAINSGGNDGFEGLAYDQAGDRLFVAKEKKPMKLYQINGLKKSLAGKFGLEVIDRSEWVKSSVISTDLSAINFDPASGHLLLLSDESSLLMELDPAGRLVDYAYLRSGQFGLHRRVRHAEGLARDSDGNLYLGAEPNRFYAFQPRPQTP